MTTHEHQDSVMQTDEAVRSLIERLEEKADEIDRDCPRTKSEIAEEWWSEIELMRAAAAALRARLASPAPADEAGKLDPKQRERIILDMAKAADGIGCEAGSHYYDEIDKMLTVAEAALRALPPQPTGDVSAAPQMYGSHQGEALPNRETAVGGATHANVEPTGDNKELVARLRAEEQKGREDIEPWQVNPFLFGEAADALVRADSRVVEGERVKKGLYYHLDRCEQEAGKALGYPWYKDDQKNFPGATDADGVCIGEHVGDTIVSELASRYREAEARVAELEARLEIDHV